MCRHELQVVGIIIYWGVDIEAEMPYLSPAAGGSSTASIELNATPPEESDPFLNISPGPVTPHPITRKKTDEKKDEEPADPLSKAFSASDLMREMFG